MILRKVLQLHEPSGPAAGSRRSVKLKHPPNPPISTDGVFHSLILPNGSLGQLLPQKQNFPYKPRLILRSYAGINEALHRLLIQFRNRRPMRGKPIADLRCRIRIHNIRQPRQLRSQLPPGDRINLQRRGHKPRIHPDTPVVDRLIQLVFLPHGFRHGIARKPLLNPLLRFHVAPVVFHELPPPFRIRG